MILVVEDDIAVSASLKLLLSNEGYTTTIANSRQEAFRILAQSPIQLVLLDMNLSNQTTGADGLEILHTIKINNPTVPVILITGWATIELAVKGMKIGASDFINKPWQNTHLLQSVQTALNLSFHKSNLDTRKKLDLDFDFKNIIGEDKKIVNILQTISRVANTDASVLITGESGTGKELIAEAIHENSKRHEKSFIKVNLGGISSSLFESEMFGHVRGAFTDARIDRIGRFELAHKGTIFLDEIGDLDLSSQVKLLRVLQDRTYEVLGSSRAKTVDVRVIAATNKNLDEMVGLHTFREDLLYRINLITVHIPALRERSGDIPLLVNYFLQNLKEIYNRPNLHIQNEAIKWLMQLPYPGNIRQLKNLVERTVLVNNHDELNLIDFQLQYEPAIKQTDTTQLPKVGSMTLDEMEIEMIKQALKYHHGKSMLAAKSLGLTKSAFYRRLEKYNIVTDENSI